MSQMSEHRPNYFSSDDEQQRPAAKAPCRGDMSDDSRCVASHRPHEHSIARIALSDDEAACLLEALDGVDATSVARLRRLRERASLLGTKAR